MVTAVPPHPGVPARAARSDAPLVSSFSAVFASSDAAGTAPQSRSAPVPTMGTADIEAVIGHTGGDSAILSSSTPLSTSGSSVDAEVRVRDRVWTRRCYLGVSDAVECLQLMVVAPSSVEVAVSDVRTATVEVRWKLEDDSGSVASGGSQSTRAPTAFVVRSKPDVEALPMVRHDRRGEADTARGADAV
jgi:hypothetical protein